MLEEKEREDIFQDFLDDLERHEKEEMIKESNRSIDQLKTLFRNSRIKADMTWDETTKKLSSNKIFKTATDLDKLTAFSEHIRERERLENERETKKEKREARIHREQFKAHLEQLRDSNQITYRSNWWEIAKLVQNNEHYLAILMTDGEGSKPKEMFIDITSELEEAFTVHK